MNVSIAQVIAPEEATGYNFIVSVFVEKVYGLNAARVATALMLWIAFASLFAVLLGYSRVPYAAAVDGNFFRFFSRLHPTKKFPAHRLIIYSCSWLIIFFKFFFKRCHIRYISHAHISAVYSAGNWCNALA